MGEHMALAMALWDSLDEEGRSDALPLDDELSADLGLALTRPAAHPQSPRRRPTGWCRALRASVVKIVALPGSGIAGRRLGRQASQEGLARCCAGAAALAHRRELGDGPPVGLHREALALRHLP